jgi:peptide/nickel transport system substrate-binding protein
MRSKASLFFAFLMAVAVVFPAVAAPLKTTADTNQMYPKISIGVAADPQDLNPWSVNSGSKPYIYHNFYENLFDFVNNDYVPVLVKEWKRIDELNYQVQIYDYIYDHAGNRITADDIVACHQYLLDNKLAVKYDIFKSVKKINDYTLVYTWSRPVSGVGDLEHPWCRTPIYSQKAFKSGSFATKPVGTGPYVVKQFVSGSKVVLEANPKYWQKNKALISKLHQAHVKTIEYHVITERAQHVIALKTGMIDVSELVPVENLREFQDGGALADKFNVWVTSGSQLWGMSCNNSPGNPGNDVNFRMAVWYAIDNEAVSKATRITVASKGFGTPHFSDYVKAWDSKPSYINTYDPKLAKEYLAKSTYDGRTIRLNSRADEPGKTMATVIQSFLVNIGIKAEITLMEAKDQGGHWAKDTWDIMIWQIGGGSQIGEYNRVMNNKELGIGMSMGFIKDDQLQLLFETARTFATHDDAHMTALHDYILEKGYLYAVAAPMINLVYTSKMAEVVLRENEFMLPGACNYYLD